MQDQFDNPFWRFSLDVYAQPGIAAECLALQSAFEIDVNLLLLVAWLSATLIPLQQKDLEELSAGISSWHDGIVRPLRRIRSDIKVLWPSESFSAFRTRVKQIELHAEQIEQALLFDWTLNAGIGGRAPGDPRIIRANLGLWQRHATSGSQDGFPEALACLLEARSSLRTQRSG